MDPLLSLRKLDVDNVEKVRQKLEEAKQEVAAATPEERAYAEFIRTPPISPPAFVSGLVGVTVVGAMPIVAGYLILGRRPDAQILTVSAVLMGLLGWWTFSYFKRVAKLPADWDNRLVFRLFLLVFVMYGQLLAGLIAWIFF